MTPPNTRLTGAFEAREKSLSAAQARCTVIQRLAALATFFVLSLAELAGCSKPSPDALGGASEAKIAEQAQRIQKLEDRLFLLESELSALKATATAKPLVNRECADAKRTARAAWVPIVERSDSETKAARAKYDTTSFGWPDYVSKRSFNALVHAARDATSSGANLLKQKADAVKGDAAGIAEAKAGSVAAYEACKDSDP